MPKYLVLIYDDEKQWETATQDDWQAMMVRHNRFHERVNAMDGAKISAARRSRLPTPRRRSGPTS